MPTMSYYKAKSLNNASKLFEKKSIEETYGEAILLVGLEAAEALYIFHLRKAIKEKNPGKAEAEYDFAVINSLTADGILVLF